MLGLIYPIRNYPQFDQYLLQYSTQFRKNGIKLLSKGKHLKILVNIIELKVETIIYILSIPNLLLINELNILISILFYYEYYKEIQNKIKIDYDSVDEKYKENRYYKAINEVSDIKKILIHVQWNKITPNGIFRSKTRNLFKLERSQNFQ